MSIYHSVGMRIVKKKVDDGDEMEVPVSVNPFTIEKLTDIIHEVREMGTRERKEVLAQKISKGEATEREKQVYDMRFFLERNFGRQVLQPDDYSDEVCTDEDLKHIGELYEKQLNNKKIQEVITNTRIFLHSRATANVGDLMGPSVPTMYL